MRTGLICNIFVILYSTSVSAQFTFIADQEIQIEKQTAEPFRLAWTGGLNSVQVNTMDLNSDNKEDLVLFDRMANTVMTFLSDGGQYRYSPEYESLFPSEVTNWILLRDYNCDGLKDIFTGDSFGIKVYKNTTETGSLVSWSLEQSPLLTKGFSGKINLQLQYDDLPAIVDADGDGDLDIFNVRFTGNSTVEYHQNFSMERTGNCNELDFERITTAWGDFTQCKCDLFAFQGDECGLAGGRINAGARVQHAGGKALLALDLDDDNDYDLILSEAECSNLYLLKNDGNNTFPLIDSVTFFPVSKAVNINIFPAAFFEDVDFDGVKDLIASPNSYKREFVSQDFKSSTWFYKNVGSDVLPIFEFMKRTFLQDEMIDVGDNAVPAFADEDGDDDLDMFIGYITDTLARAGIYFFENIGTPSNSRFRLITDDYLSLRSQNLYNIKPQFADINNDSQTDLTFTGTNESGITSIYYLINETSRGLKFRTQEINEINVQISFSENYHFTHINHDGQIDLLIGRSVGSVEFWANMGASTPRFYQENESYLGINRSVQRQSLAICAADLNNDGKDDLILADQSGKMGVINDFHEARDASLEMNNIIFNTLTEDYQSTRLGRTWPTAALLFNSKRPAIVAGTIRGGIRIFRNEDKELTFDELVLNVYPNPVENNVVNIETNLSAQLQIISMQGQEIGEIVVLQPGRNIVDIPSVAKGLYIFRFVINGKTTFKKIVVK
jgi:hypothetical protein